MAETLNRFTAAGLKSEMLPGPYFDKDGRFRSVEYATQHALMIQQGFSTTQIEAERMTRSTDEIERTMGERFLAGDPMDVLEPANAVEQIPATRERYIADSDSLTLTPVEDKPETNLTPVIRRARSAARKILAARAAKKDADRVIASLKDTLLADMELLGTEVIEVEGGERVQKVTPVSVKVIGEADLIKALERHRPEFLDSVAPAKRVVSKEQLIAFIDSGSLPASWRKYIAHVEGTTQIR